MKDFINNNFHDNRIYSIEFPNKDAKLRFNIDHIIEWIQSEESISYKFLIAPAIMSFDNVFNLILNINFDGYYEIIINDISISGKRKSEVDNKLFIWDLNIFTNVGKISFSTTGFNLEYINAPVYSESQFYER